MADVRVLRADDWRVWRDLRLQALAEAPHAFGSRLADWQGVNDREDRWRSRLASAPLNLVVAVDDQPAGMASGVMGEHEGVVELISMWVSPDARGQGVADVLVARVADWAKHTGARKLVLNVKGDNVAAIGLYRRHGFAPAAPADRDPERDDDEDTMVKELFDDDGSRR